MATQIYSIANKGNASDDRFSVICFTLGVRFMLFTIKSLASSAVFMTFNWWMSELLIWPWSFSHVTINRYSSAMLHCVAATFDCCVYVWLFFIVVWLWASRALVTVLISHFLLSLQGHFFPETRVIVVGGSGSGTLYLVVWRECGIEGRWKMSVRHDRINERKWKWRAKNNENGSRTTHQNKGLVVQITGITLLQRPNPLGGVLGRDFWWAAAGHGATNMMVWLLLISEHLADGGFYKMSFGWLALSGHHDN